MPYGKLHEFDIHNKANWGAYVRLVKQFILLNEIKLELRVATLVTHVGAATYELMCDLCSPNHPEDKQFEELVTLVSEHLEPKRSEIAERHIFRQRRQAESESVGTFLQNLKHLATHCNFGVLLEENIRDQFVSGLRSEEMRSRLFAEPTLDYKKAVELALALEAAERHAETAAASGGAVAAVSGSADSGLGQGGNGLHRVAPGDAAGYARRRGAACWRCGKCNHAPNKCRFKYYTCNKCCEKGHLAIMCVNSAKSNNSRFKSQNYIEQSDSQSDASDGLYHFSTRANSKDDPYYLELKVEGRIILFEVDTGSKISAVSKQFYDDNFSYLPILKENVKFRSYSGGAIVPLGRIEVSVKRGNDSAILPLFVITNGGPPLMGRLWLRKLNLKTLSLFNITHTTHSIVSSLKLEFPEVFKEGIGTFKNEIKLNLKENTEPIFCKARPIPLALRLPVERELKRLEAESIIFKVERSDYGTPIVPIIKRDGTIRICGDYKITVNKQLKDFHYPLPRIEQLFAALSGGEQYTKLDLRNAYLQLNLDKASQPLTAITTHVGIYVYRRAPFGLKCLPEMFQKIIEEILCGINNVVCFIDDICITGCSKEVHMKNLKNVLSKLRDAGLRIKLEKCEFFKNEVCYLGYKINRNGLYTDDSKVAAITNLPAPQNVSQLRPALGLVNYYSRFLKNVSTTLHPLYSLLAKGARWAWTDACQKAFENIKEQLVIGPVLAHYEPQLPLVLAVDSSAYGLGAVLSHIYPDGTERIVCCASRTLNDAERRYSQIDKEALAIVYGVTRHHQYVFGRKFTLRSDHKALTYIFGPKNGIPQTAASRLQRYAVRLAAYDFDIVFVPTDKNGNADGLSRLPMVSTKDVCKFKNEEAAYVHYVEDTFPLNYRDVAREIKKDAILCKIYSYILSGWPDKTEIENEKPFFHRKEALQVDHGCIVWGYRIVIPRSLRKHIIEEIHAGHVGTVRMKQIARNYAWWPQIDSDIEERARSCVACRGVRDAPPHASPVPYAWPHEPWTRLHADFLYYKGKHYFLVIDAHSKWIEVAAMTTGTSANLVIGKLRELFARFGLPRQLVTDGGPPFTSFELGDFLKKNSIQHIVTAPYHPASNGAAENAVKTIKKVMKKATADGQNIEEALNIFLLQYRNSAHCSTQKEPAVAMIGRRLRTRLDQIRAPSAAQCVASAQRTQVGHAGGSHRDFMPGDSVLIRNYSKQAANWSEGTIAERTGSVTYKVNTNGNQTGTKHADQLIAYKPKRFSWAFGVDENTADGSLEAASTTETKITSPASNTFVSAETTAEVSQPSVVDPLASPPESKTRTRTPVTLYKPPTLRPRTARPNYKEN